MITGHTPPFDTVDKPVPTWGNAACTPEESMAACLLAEGISITWSEALYQLRQPEYQKIYDIYHRMAQRAIEHFNRFPTKFSQNKKTYEFWLGANS
jgi:hypothetical protein